MDPAWTIAGDRAGRNRANLGSRGVARAVDRAVDAVRLSDARKVVALRSEQGADPMNVQPCWTVPELAAYLQVNRRTVTAWRSAFPDLRFTLEDLLVEGDKVVARWTCRGTHHGVFRGMAPTGKRVTFTGMTLSRMAQGKIVEQWTVEDGVSLYQQLGILRS